MVSAEVSSQMPRPEAYTVYKPDFREVASAQRPDAQTTFFRRKIKDARSATKSFAFESLQGRLKVGYQPTWSHPTCLTN
jgi:hypothetical protein